MLVYSCRNYLIRYLAYSSNTITCNIYKNIISLNFNIIKIMSLFLGYISKALIREVKI